MVGRVRSPGQVVDRCLVELQSCTRVTLLAGVQQRHRAVVHANQRHVVGIVLVPGHTEDRLVPRGFEQYVRFAQVSNIELPSTAVGSNCGEYLSVGGETHVVDLFVVGDDSAVDDPLLNVPNGASSVNTAGDDR